MIDLLAIVLMNVTAGFLIHYMVHDYGGTLPEFKGIVYVAGPMTNLKDLNRKSFEYAEKILTARGYEVRHSACLPTHWSDYDAYIKTSLAIMSTCEYITFLPGSGNSKGAKTERAVAAINGIKYLSLGDVTTTQQINKLIRLREQAGK